MPKVCVLYEGFFIEGPFLATTAITSFVLAFPPEVDGVVVVVAVAGGWFLRPEGGVYLEVVADLLRMRLEVLNPVRAVVHPESPSEHECYSNHILL